MIFDILLGSPILEDIKINRRDAVRGVILLQNKVLLIHTNKGDYKLPGGGVKNNETHSEALQREILEETGYKNCVVREKIGAITERHIDEYDENAFFQMNSHYYLCELLLNDKVEQRLDDYESKQEFMPKWVSIDDAIAENEKCLRLPLHNEWVYREMLVLKELKKYYSETV